ncbi:hypothetical protein KIW84_021552 [Lathyrus oleraceus]|uniref:RHOMBOID-like protein n=1 Tax=Pisum sativum TaxID=3888 RepID=A0A9D4Y8X2_PEA|nr:hypothetical protein KIW84_021552 [Pisum sativum]
MSHYAKNWRENKTTEPPPCVIYPKGGKGNARSKPGKDMVSRPERNGIGSRLCEGKVLAPLRIRRTRRDPHTKGRIRLLKTAHKHHTLAGRRHKKTRETNSAGYRILGLRSLSGTDIRVDVVRDRGNVLARMSHPMHTYLLGLEKNQSTRSSANTHIKPHKHGQTWNPNANRWTYISFRTKHTHTGNQMPLDGLIPDSKHTTRGSLGTFPFGSNFSNIGGFTSGFLLGFVILTRRQHHWLNLNKSNTSQKQESYQYPLQIISFVLLSVGLVSGGVLFFKGVDLNDYCSWCHYIICAPPSCKPGYISCEDYQIGNKPNVTCLNNGRSGIFSLSNRNPDEQAESLCYRLCGK